MKPIYFLFYWFFKGLITLFYRLEVHGIQNIPQGAAIIAPNHTSYLDPPVVGVSLPSEVFFLARGSLFSYPGFSQFIRILNAYPVKGQTTELETIKLLSKLLTENKKVIIFPEGRRSDDGKLTELKSGIGMLSLRSNAPIVPTYLKGTFEIWPRNHFFPKPWGKITCYFGAPIDPQKYQSMPRKEAQQALSNDVYNAIKKLEA